MDFIDKAIEKLGINELHTEARPSWEDFEKKSIGKKLFLFGAGSGAGFYWKKYGDDIPVCGVLDNGANKHGQFVGDVVPEASITKSRNIKITSIDEIKKYKPDELVILITSLYYYEEIRDQLKDYNIENIYVLLFLEAKYRKENKNYIEENESVFSNLKERYVDYCCQLPIKREKIVFESFGAYSDHGKYITEQILKNRDDLDIVWMVNDINEDVPQGVRRILLSNWKQFIYELETAHIWIINNIIPAYIKKRKGQIYIHTKHWASITLKRFFLDATTITDVPDNVKLWKHNGKCIDYMITGSVFDQESCRRGFHFQKEFINVGSPRTDAMFHSEENKEKVYSFFHMNPEQKLVLYAPTYRYKKTEDVGHYAEARNYELNYELLKMELERKFGGNWLILLRLHPSVASASKKMTLPFYVIDASDYADSEELCAACEILISDYSSIMFEPAFVKKPVFLFATDRQEYIDKEYDLLINYDQLPFPMAESNAELVEKIREFDQVLYEKKVSDFLDSYGVHEDGHASERAANFILDLVETVG